MGVSPGFILEANNLIEKEKQIAPALDAVYQEIDSMILQGQFNQLDNEIKHVVDEPLDTDMILAVLTSTVRAKDKLPSRLKFYNNAIELLKSRNQMEASLLTELK